jgi:hypothetical protein
VSSPSRNFTDWRASFTLVTSPKNLVIAFLVVTTAAGGVLAWQQYQELISLRAAAMDHNERADWQKRLWDAEKKRHELEDALAAMRAKASDAKDSTDDSAIVASSEGPSGPRRRPANAANFMALMEKPEIQKLMALQQRGALDSHYAALFKKLNLTPDQLEKFKSLLVEKQTAMADIMAAARAQGLDPRSDPQEFRKLVTDTQAEIDANIKATLGDASFSQYQQYQQTLPQRNVVSQLEQALSYTSTPLSTTQADQMVQILANTSPGTRDASNRTSVAIGIGAAFGAPGPTSRITDTAIAQSQGVLAPSQIQALQQLQQTQQAQAQLSQAMRTQLNPQTRATPPAPKPATGPGG